METPTAPTPSLVELTDWIWYEVPRDQKNCPSPRQLHTGVLNRDEWFIFGGFAQEYPLDELWSLSLVTKEWRQVKKLMRAWPRARHSHIAAYRTIPSKRRNSMVVFGGVTENGEILNDVWEWSFRSSSWKKLDTTGEVPAPRWGHSAVIYQDELWVYGGFTSSWNSELYCLNLGTLVWRRINAEGAPFGRHFHSANVYQDKMYIFGGLDTKNLGDLHSFHFATGQWEKVEQKNRISKRRGHQTIVFDHYLIVHGGRDNKAPSNDLNFFNFETYQWETIKVDSTAPTPRYYHALCFWQNAMIVFGGLGVHRDDPALKTNGKLKYSNLNDLYYYSFKGNVFTDINSINGRLSLLPLEILKYCLEFLNADALGKLARVNRFFYFVSSAENLWRNHLYTKNKAASVLSQSFLNDLDQGYLVRKQQSTANNNNNNNTPKPISDAIRLDDLLSMMQTKMKPDLNQFYWKFQYIDKIVFRNGFSWKPQRDPHQAASGCYAMEKERKSNNYYDLKMVVLGSGGVGKTSSVIQYIQHHFIQEYDPGIEDSFRKQVMIPDTESSVILDILDTYGQEEYSAMRDQYMRHGQGFIIMYSVANATSFQEIETYIDQLRRVKDQEVCDIPIVLVGNKCDLTENKEVFPKQAMDLAKKYDVPLFEASAKNRINSDEQFVELLREIAFKIYSKKTPPPTKKRDCVIQ